MILGFLFWFSASLGIQEFREADIGLNIYEHPPIYAELEVHAENDWLDIYGIYQNEMEPILPMFMPKNDTFIVGATVSIGAFSITAEHMCEHPVANFDIEISGEYGGYNRIFATITSK